jgi:tryptophan synthase beta subunit
MRNPIPGALVVLNLSGRGDKDVPQVASYESR